MMKAHMDTNYDDALNLARERIIEIEAKIGYLRGQRRSVRAEINELQIDRLKLRRILVAAQCSAELESLDVAIEARERWGRQID